MNRHARNEHNDTQRNEPSPEENKIAERVLDAAFIVHKELGAGLLESAYETCLCDVLSDYQLSFERQKNISIPFRNKIIDAGFRADIIVEDKVLIELKAVEKVLPVHEAQIITYLKLSKLNLGLLLNFNTKLLKHGIKRFVYTQ